MRKAILSAVVCLSLGTAMGQQDPQYSNFMFDKLSVNPGYAGMSGMYCGTVMYRNQWLGFDGAPKTMLLNLDGSISAIRGGAGLTFYNDKLGVETNNILRLAYSYHLPVGPGKLGIGASFGLASKAFDAVWDPIDPAASDPSIPGTTDRQGAFDANFGLYWKHATGNTYGGISMTHLNGAGLDQINIDIARHLWLMAGHTHFFNGSLWGISGDFIAKSDLASTQFDIAVRGWYNKMFYAGVSYRHKDAIFPMAGVKKQLPSPEGSCSKMFITGGLAYDITLSNIKDYSSGSIDVFVKFCFQPCLNPTVPKPVDVRFLGS